MGKKLINQARRPDGVRRQAVVSMRREEGGGRRAEGKIVIFFWHYCFPRIPKERRTGFDPARIRYDQYGQGFSKGDNSIDGERHVKH